MMEVPFNLNNPFRGEMKSMEYKGYLNLNRNDKQERKTKIIDYKPDPTPQSMEQWAEISGYQTRKS